MTVKGRVAIVTGAGGGLGREYALLLANRGAKVVVNDYGGTLDGQSGSISRAQAVADEITKAGGVAIADGHDVSIKGERHHQDSRTHCSGVRPSRHSH